MREIAINQARKIKAYPPGVGGEKESASGFVLKVEQQNHSTADPWWKRVKGVRDDTGAVGLSMERWSFHLLRRERLRRSQLGKDHQELCSGQAWVSK